MKIQNITLTLAAALMLITTNVYADPANSENSNKKNDQEDVVYIEVYNPETGQIEVQSCLGYPDCEIEGMIPPIANLDDDIEKQE